MRLGNVLSPGEFSNFVPDTSATQEVAVDYAAVSAEQPFGGLRIDIIPREGGNTFRGTVFATGVNSAWQTSNLTDELRNLGLPEPNEMKKAYDINPGWVVRSCARTLVLLVGALAVEPELHRWSLLQQERRRPDEVVVRAGPEPARLLLSRAERYQYPADVAGCAEAQGRVLLRLPVANLG